MPGEYAARRRGSNFERVSSIDVRSYNHGSDASDLFRQTMTQETSCYRAKRRKPPRKTQKLGQRRIRTLRGSEALGIGAYKLVTWMGVVARTGISAIHEMLSLGEGKCSLGICILMFF
ncbi:hypothetical protein Tco_0332945 [Tanacetum coccineum]